MNDRSKELQHEVNKLKAQLEFLETRNYENLENLVQKIQGGLASVRRGQQAPDTDQVQEKEAKTKDEELYNKLLNLIENLSSQKAEGGGATHMIQWPPVPLSGPYGNWSDIREGYSYRFKSKIPVQLDDFYNEQGFDQLAAKYEIAALQLHNLETIELLERKEREISTLNTEIEDIRTEMRNMLLVQDELFKQYVEEKKKYEEKIKQITNDCNRYREANEENEKKVKLLEDLIG